MRCTRAPANMHVLPESASSYGADIDYIVTLITWITGVWFVAAEGILLWFLFRYRRREGVKAAYAPGTTLRAAAWVLVPVAGVLVCDLIIEHEGKGIWERIKMEVPEKPDLTVRINGKQFIWEITHPGLDGELGTADDIQTFSDLHVPVDADVKFELTSTDVIHSFFVPNFRLKQDAVPGRRIEGWFRATREGVFQIACAELCGIAHTTMKGTVTVESPEKHKQWILDESGAQSAEAP